MPRTSQNEVGARQGEATQRGKGGSSGGQGPAAMTTRTCDCEIRAGERAVAGLSRNVQASMALGGMEDGNGCQDEEWDVIATRM